MRMSGVFLCLTFALTFTVFGEEIKPLSQEQLEAIAIQPASNWGKTGNNIVPEMLPLFKEELIEFNDETRKYRLHVPENLEPDKKYPLILWLHGTGESGNDNKLQLVHLHHIITSLIGEKKRDFFLLVPQCSDTEYWGRDYGSGMRFRQTGSFPSDIEKGGQEAIDKYKKDLLEQTQAASPDCVVTIKEIDLGTRTERNFLGMTKQVPIKGFEITGEAAPKKQGGSLEMSFAMIDHAVEQYPIDTDRITLSGLSSGGDGTWRALEKRPELFAAAVPLVSWTSLSDESLEKSPILKKIPIWAIYSSDDRGIDEARAEFERAEKAGCNVKKTEFGICGHTAWTPAMLQADIFNWLLSRGKKGDEYVQVFDPGIDPDDMKGIVDVATRDPGKPALAPAVIREVSIPAPSEPVGRASTVRQVTPKIQADVQERIRQQRETMQQRIEEMRSRNRDIAILPAVNPTLQDEAYARIAIQYSVLTSRQDQTDSEAIYDRLEKTLRKITPQRRTEVIMHIVDHQQTLVGVTRLEKLLDEMSMPTTTPVTPWGVSVPASVPAETGAPSEEAVVEEEGTPTFSAQRIIEECDRPWAMTSDSLYGMFPADWGKEAEAVPEFIVNSDTNDLAKKLAVSIGTDDEAKDFVAACRSILLLQNKPMSSPWFETGGGRLRSDIQYTLSAKGEMFVRFLKTVKDSGRNSPKAAELAKVAERTLEKIDMVMAK